VIDLAEQSPKFPERTDLNFEGCKVVKSKKTQETLLVVEAKDRKSGNLYSVWLRGESVGLLLSEIGKMIPSK